MHPARTGASRNFGKRPREIGAAFGNQLIGQAWLTGQPGKTPFDPLQDLSWLLEHKPIAFQATDIETSNGVIHVIDAVILPPAAEEPAAPPEVMPVTGLALGGALPGSLVAVLATASVLAAGTWIARRRNS